MWKECVTQTDQKYYYRVYPYKGGHSSLSSCGVTTCLRVRRPGQLTVVEDGIGVDLVRGQHHLEGVCLCLRGREIDRAIIIESVRGRDRRDLIRLTHIVQGHIDSSGEGHVLPGDNRNVLGEERVRTHDSCADVPHGTLTHLHAHTIGSRRQITFHSNGKLGGKLIRDVRIRRSQTPLSLFVFFEIISIKYSDSVCAW